MSFNLKTGKILWVLLFLVFTVNSAHAKGFLKELQADFNNHPTLKNRMEIKIREFSNGFLTLEFDYDLDHSTNEYPKLKRIGTRLANNYKDKGIKDIIWIDIRRETLRIASQAKSNGDKVFNQKNYKEAIVFYKKALALNPSYDLYDAIARAHHNMGDFSNAIEYYNTALVWNPNSVSTYDNLGRCYRALKAYSVAAKNFEKAFSLARGKQRDALLSSVAGAYLGSKQYDIAVSWYTKMVKWTGLIDTKTTFYGYKGLGLTYWHLLDYDTSKLYFKKAKNLLHVLSKERQNSAGLYLSLFHYIVQTKTGYIEDAKAELISQSEKLDLSKWPGKIVKLYLGKITSEDVEKDMKSLKSGQKMEANYYLGEFELFKGDKERAMLFLGFVVRDYKEHQSYTEYGLAELNVKLLSTSSSPKKGIDEDLADAINSGKESVVKTLLSKGANPNHLRWGEPLLMRAMFGGGSRINIAKLLIKAGADVNAKRNDGATTLRFADSVDTMPIRLTPKTRAAIISRSVTHIAQSDLRLSVWLHLVTPLRSPFQTSNGSSRMRKRA